MNRVWSILFFLIPVGGIAAFLLAANGLPPFVGAWLPANFSQNGESIDGLFMLVHWICALFFVGIGCAIGWIIWRFNASKRETASYYHSNVKLELLWSFVPGAILIFLAFYQLQTWAAQKVDRPTIVVNGETIFQPASLRVVARQYDWEFQYAGKDKKLGTPDDFSIQNLMVVPDDNPIVMQMESRDVIHSFFVPKLRLKQDIIPGATQFVWFKPTATAEMNILCAELCGWGHYKMTAILRIVPRAEYEAWIEEQQRKFDPPELVPYSNSRP